MRQNKIRTEKLLLRDCEISFETLTNLVTDVVHFALKN